jgi:transposase
MMTEPPFSPALWDQTPAAVQEYIRTLEARVTALEASVQRLEATVQHVTERLQQDSRTSSRPPSSDPPQATAKRPRREPSGRRPGGQPGHEGHTRGVVPVAAVDVVGPVKPERCRRCQHPLSGEAPHPQRHQVTDIPPVQPRVTASQLQPVVCPVGGEVTPAELPRGVPTGGFGPRVQAITARCTGAYHVSQRPTQDLLEDLCGVSMGLGTVATLEHATVHAVAEPVAAARAYVQAQPAAHLDETGWREGQPRAWLWTMVTTGVTVFVVRRSRRGKVAHARRGERCWGWVVTDRWRASSWDPTGRRQRCGAHLRRDLDAMIARGGRSQEIGEALRAQARQMFHGWPRVRDGTLAPATFARYMWPVRRDMERLLAAGQTCGVPTTEGTCRELLQLRQALWTCGRHDGVDPTHNTAERAIRPGVIWRKRSVGTQSPEGSRVVEAMMTVVATLKQQHRHVLAYVTAACEAALCGEPAPSLLPPLDALNQVMRPAA